VGLSTNRVNLQVEVWRCSFGYVKPSWVVFISDPAMQVLVKDIVVFATLSSGCLVDWVHSRSDSDWFIDRNESLYRFCCFVVFGLGYPGSALDLLKSAGSKGLGAFAALEFCSLRIGSLGSKGLVMLLYFVSGAVGS